MSTDVHGALVRTTDGVGFSLIPSPPARPDQVIAAPEYTSLCGTDVQILMGMRTDPARIVGHEGIVGLHTAEGPRRVTVNPTDPEDSAFLLGHNIDGLLQQRVLLPASLQDRGLLADMPAGLRGPLGTLVEPLSVVRYGLDTLARTGATRLIIVGGGLIGALAAITAPRDRWNDGIEFYTRSDRTLIWAEETLEAGVYPLPALRDSGAPTALLLSTYRNRTVAELDRAAKVLGTSLIAVHAIGGVAEETTSSGFPGLDLHRTRALNTGGPWPASVEAVTARDKGHRVTFSGNRGVRTTWLETSARLLAAEPAGYSALLSHVAAPSTAADIITEVIRGQRVFDGRPLIRLVVDWTQEAGG